MYEHISSHKINRMIEVFKSYYNFNLGSQGSFNDIKTFFKLNLTSVLCESTLQRGVDLRRRVEEKLFLEPVEPLCIWIKGFGTLKSKDLYSI